MKKIFYVNLILAVFVVVFSTSCQKKDNFFLLKGSWLINSLEFEKSDLTGCLMVNAILFSDSIAYLPWDLCDSNFVDSSKNGLYRVLENNKKDELRLAFNTDNKLFRNEVFNIKFNYSSALRRLTAELRSNKTQVLLTKEILFLNEAKEIERFLGK